MKTIFTLASAFCLTSSFALAQTRGFYCQSSKGSTLSFVSLDKNGSTGVLILNLPGKPVKIVPNAKRNWSGSMYITSGDNIITQGPGNGVSNVSVLETQESFEFKTECRDIDLP